MLHTCPKHGLTDHTESKGKRERLRCKRCSVEAVQRRRRKIKQMAVNYLGGKCRNCGYSKCVDALEFHHRDPTQKDFNVSDSGHCRSWEKVKIELNKCDLLCANCHREEHATAV
jgi:hypothetical protein